MTVEEALTLAESKTMEPDGLDVAAVVLAAEVRRLRSENEAVRRQLHEVAG